MILVGVQLLVTLTWLPDRACMGQDDVVVGTLRWPLMVLSLSDLGNTGVGGAGVASAFPPVAEDYHGGHR
ncbi:hypothetical protein NDU88_003343 [Pleurodeles waltl]|uniref:Secreted protein n=1 Tax=Pleurodeles waltl TaxID=8319 RepID=A0AAV7KWA1_PLEWA|nr:hypothetical protein NDU88_003343 [Pleurodeles waltl]